MLDDLVEGGGAVGTPQCEGEARARARERPEPHAREDLGRAGVPRVGDDERLTLVQCAELGALLVLCRWHASHHGQSECLLAWRASNVGPTPCRRGRTDVRCGSERGAAPLTRAERSRERCRLGQRRPLSHRRPAATAAPARAGAAAKSPHAASAAAAGAATVRRAVRAWSSTAVTSGGRAVCAASCSVGQVRRMTSGGCALRPSRSCRPWCSRTASPGPLRSRGSWPCSASRGSAGSPAPARRPGGTGGHSCRRACRRGSCPSRTGSRAGRC